jgi:hypothetical protein
MSAWNPGELAGIAGTEEVAIASQRPDGTLRPYTTIWVVRVGDDLYVRSYHGRDGRWFQAAMQRGQGRIRAAGVERDVSFTEAGGPSAAAIDDAYREKYARYPAYVEPMVSAGAAAATLSLAPR